MFDKEFEFVKDSKMMKFEGDRDELWAKCYFDRQFKSQKNYLK